MGLFAITSVRPRRGRECSPLVPLGPDAGKASLVEEERELDRLGHRRVLSGDRAIVAMKSERRMRGGILYLVVGAAGRE